MTLDGWAEGLMWLALAAGISCFLTGAITLAGKRVVEPWLRGRVDWQPFGWGQVAFAVFVAIEVVPRLAHAPTVVTLVLSLLAFAPLAVGGILLSRAQPRPV